MGLGIGHWFRKSSGSAQNDNPLASHAGQVREQHKGRSIKHLFDVVNVRLPRGKTAVGVPLEQRDVRAVRPDNKQFREIQMASALAKACTANDMDLQRKEKAAQRDCVEIYGIKVKKNFLFTTCEFQTVNRDARGKAGEPQTHKRTSLRFNLASDLKKMIRSIKAETGAQAAEIEVGHLSNQINGRLGTEDNPGKCILLKGDMPRHGNNKHAELLVAYRQAHGNKIILEKKSYVSWGDADDFISRLAQYPGSRRSVVAMQLAADQVVDDVVSRLED